MDGDRDGPALLSGAPVSGGGEPGEPEDCQQPEACRQHAEHRARREPRSRPEQPHRRNHGPEQPQHHEHGGRVTHRGADRREVLGGQARRSQTREPDQRGAGRHQEGGCQARGIDGQDRRRDGCQQDDQRQRRVGQEPGRQRLRHDDVEPHGVRDVAEGAAQPGHGGLREQQHHREHRRSRPHPSQGHRAANQEHEREPHAPRVLRR